MLTHIGIAIITFVVTNIDDLLILSLYFSNSTYKTSSVVAGQYLGISILILVSLVGLLLGAFLADHWISLLGIFPVLLGLKDLLRLENDDEDNAAKTGSKFQLVNVALVTIANGGDNIGVYTPLFINLPTGKLYIYLTVFMILTGGLCALGFYFVRHPLIKNAFARFGKKILPYFLIILGLFIMKDFLVWLF